MKPFVILAAVAAALVSASSRVEVKYSSENLIVGSQDAASDAASVLSLARHAMESLAVPSVVVPVDVLPLSADVFQHTAAYGIVVVEGTGAEGLSTDKADYAFQKTMPLQDKTVDQVPRLVNVLAHGLKGKNAKNVVLCGGDSLCRSVDTEVKAELGAAHDDDVWTALPSFDKENAADQRIVRDIATMKSLVASAQAADQSSKALYVASISNLAALSSPAKQTAAKAVVAEAVRDLQAALKARYTNVGVQVLALTAALPLDVTDVAVAFARRLDAATGLSANASANSSTAEPLTIETIAEYQIILWSSIILAVVTLLAISMLCSMDASRDNLLYAKFLTDASNRKND